MRLTSAIEVVTGHPWFWPILCFIAGMTISAWTFRLFPERGAEALRIDVTRPAFDAHALYVGRIDIDRRRIETDLYIRIVVFCFNGTGKPIEIRSVSGAIQFRADPTAREVEYTRLPVPSLHPPGAAQTAIEMRKEFTVTVEQRLPRELIAVFQERMAGGGLELNLSQLDISVGPVGDQGTSIRVPIYTAVKVSTDAARLAVGRIADITIPPAVLGLRVEGPHIRR